MNTVRLEELADAQDLRPDILAQLLAYHREHKQPEPFVRRVLENDLIGAARCWHLADGWQQARYLACFCYRWIPSNEWGDRVRVADWLDAQTLESMPTYAEIAAEAERLKTDRKKGDCK